jgi:hypothetical protein
MPCEELTSADGIDVRARHIVESLRPMRIFVGSNQTSTRLENWQCSYSKAQ